MKVIHFQRATGIGVSIERLFDHVRSALPDEVEVDVKYLPYGGTSPIHLLKNMWFAFRNQGDVNHITGDCYYIALAMNPRRTIVTIHDCVNLHKLKGLARRIFKLFWYDLPCRWARRVTVISVFAKQELLENVRISADRVSVVHNCVDPLLLPEKFRKESKPFVLLQIGTKVNKNVLRVAEAVGGLMCHLRIVGQLDRVQVDTLNKYNVDYSSVVRISDEELRREYADADALIFVSTYEGFGLPIVEAQAVGLPVVTSALEPMHEVAGMGALLVDPYDVCSIRDAVQRVLEHDLEALVERGFENVQRFRSESTATGYLTVYKEVLSHEN